MADTDHFDIFAFFGTARDKPEILPRLCRQSELQAEYVAAHEHWYTTERAYRNWARRRRGGSKDYDFPSPVERINAEERRDAARAALLKHMKHAP